MSTKRTTELRLAPVYAVKRAPDADAGAFAGYASTFLGQPDSYGDVIAPHAFSASLAEHRAAGTLPSLLWAHRQDTPVGRLTEIREDDVGLWVEGALNQRTTAGKDAYEALRAGDVSGLSIGFQAKAREGAMLTEVHVLEVSIVCLPANARARVSAIKSLESRRELEDLLHDVGLPKAAAKKITSGGWSALVGDDEAAGCSFCESSKYDVLTAPNGTRLCRGCLEDADRLFAERHIDHERVAKEIDALTIQLKSLR